MSHLYGVGMNITVNRINTEFKCEIQKRGGIGIRSLANIFRRMDHNGNKKLDIQEFTEALAAFNLFPKKVDIQALMKYYDIDNDGNITYEEFIRGLREPLSERRQRMVEIAWEQLDRDGSGQVTVSDICQIYDVRSNKDYIEGRKTKEEILEDFLSGFEGKAGNKDGVITKAEFFDYYTDLSMSVTKDEYFVGMMESVWCVGEDESTQVFKEQLRHVVGVLRQKLLSFTHHGKMNQDEYVLRKLFNDFDTNKSGDLTIDELAHMLAKLGISVERKYLTALFKLLDTSKNGVVEFEEFNNFIIHNPYK